MKKLKVLRWVMVRCAISLKSEVVYSSTKDAIAYIIFGILIKNHISIIPAFVGVSLDDHTHFLSILKSA